MFFLEMRPSEKGRYALVRVSPEGEIDDVIPQEFNARNRVHEYGGGSYVIRGESSTVLFSNFADQRIYKAELGKSDKPIPITATSDVFYADYIIDEKRSRLICVQEDHRRGGEAVNTIVSAGMDGGSEVVTLLSGNDFYSSPRISPDGKKLAWMTWNHPELPFLGSELWISDVSENGTLSNHRRVAGSTAESIVEPRWSPEGVLYFVSDRSNWWNIYRFVNNAIENVLPMEAEFSGPHWRFGMSSYSFVSEQRIVCTYAKEGFSHFAYIDTTARTLRNIDNPFSDILYLDADDQSCVLIAGSPSSSAAVYDFSFGDSKFRKLYPVKSKEEIDPSYLSLPAAVEFPTVGNRTAHALYYAPKNNNYEGISGSLPPLIVISHGGPTGRCHSELDFGIQYWTSRGFAVMDVNYGGSTGYGREYRLRLAGNWGVVDVDDCVSAARYLVDKKAADRDKLIIRGGSAGGYTTLSALAFKTAFKAGASYYGISDLELFEKDTHKFESRYLDFLIGPFPERRDLYRSRSALNYLGNVSAPVIFFQGLEDKIVPPNQAEVMFDALRKKGLPTAYIAYEGEQHGFRQAKNIARSYEAELYFYSRVFKFDLPKPAEPVIIENL